MQDIIQRIKSNDHLALSRIISKVENEESIPDSFFIDIHPDTFHYQMWYTCYKSELIDKEINKDIRNSIYNIFLFRNSKR